MALTCPQCAASMNEVTAAATTGYLILLDQCPRCGGIWCDRWELYPVTAAAAERLDPVNQEALCQPTIGADAHVLCPRCRARMRPMRDPALPADARIERCPNCDGMWLNRGELRRFKHRGTMQSRLDEAAVDRLAAAASPEPQSLPKVRTLSAAFDGLPEANESADVRRELTRSAAWLIARAAMRLLLHI